MITTERRGGLLGAGVAALLAMAAGVVTNEGDCGACRRPLHVVG